MTAAPKDIMTPIDSIWFTRTLCIQLVISYLLDNHPHHHSLLFDFYIIKLDSTWYWKVYRIISSCMQDMDHAVGFHLGANVRNWDCIAGKNNKQNTQEQWLLCIADGWWDCHLVSFIQWFVHGCFLAGSSDILLVKMLAPIYQCTVPDKYFITLPSFLFP